MDEFEYKGFKYRIVSVVDATVELIYAGKLTGKVVVPEEVEYQNQKCKVVAIRGAKKTEYYDYQPDDKRRKVERRSREVICPVFVGQTLQSFQDKLEVVLPKSLKEIGDYAFYYCKNLVSVNIPDSVTSIGNDAFYECCKLTSVNIPNSVTSIGNYAFEGCSSLTSVHITDLAVWCGISYDFPQDYNLYLNGALVTDLVIPDSVTNIGEYAFRGCSSLTSVAIPNSVTSIGHYAFKGCSSLISVTIPNSVTWIGGETFKGCSSLTSITIPNSVTSIGKEAFKGCSSLTSIAIPNSVTNIGGETFKGCSSLTSITIPNSVTSIGDSAFDGCKSLTSITIPNNVTSIGYSAFQGCSSLTSITIPDSVTSIRGETFMCCSSLTSITIPNSVTSIGKDAFYHCFRLTSVTIPDSVTSIEEEAFYGCNLTSVTIENDEGKVIIRKNALPYNAKITYVGKPKEQPAKLAEKEIAQAKPEAPKATTPNTPGVVIDLEKLMAAALIDGVVTDKERAILIKKVKEAGGDVDEFEMLLDARIHETQQKQAQQQPTKPVEKESQLTPEVRKAEGSFMDRIKNFFKS